MHLTPPPPPSLLLSFHNPQLSSPPLSISAFLSLRCFSNPSLSFLSAYLILRCSSPILSSLSSPPFLYYVASPILPFLSSPPILYYVALLQSFPFFPLRFSYTTLFPESIPFIPLRLSYTTLLLQSFPFFPPPFSTFCLTFTTPPPLYFRSTHPPSNPSSLLSHYFTFSFLSLILLVHTLPPPVSLNGDDLFGVPSRFSLLYNLSVYCTACLRCFKVGPVLEINRDLHFSTLLLTFPLSISLFLFYIFLSPLPSSVPFSSTPSLLFFLSLPPPVSFTFLSPTHSYAPPFFRNPPFSLPLISLPHLLNN